MAAESEGLARSAGVIALGNVTSRLLGLARVTIIAHLFGASGPASAFEVAARVPTMIYDFLISGMLTAALVPVLSAYAERRDEFWRLVSILLSATALATGALVLLLELLAPQVAWIMAGGFEPALLTLTTRLIRLILPATVLFGLSGVVTGALYSLKRFTFPAFGATVFNLGIVIAAPLLAGRLDIYSLAVGVLAGALAQLAIQIPGLRGARVTPHLDLRHPGLRRILKLYLPIAAGLIISQIQVIIDRRLASGTGAESIARMANATQIIQFPHGLVAVAISMAALPSLARLSAAGDWEGYRHTLAAGLRLVIALIAPAIAGLYLLGRPVIQLIFEHGRFTAVDTHWVTLALYGYLIGLFFASIDWPLNYAFYARQDTLTPALVGLLSVFIYLGVALVLLRPLGMLGLVLADSAKHAGHALTMIILLRRRVGPLRGGFGVAAGKVLLATAGMSAVVWGVWLGATRGLSLPAGFIGEAVAVALPAAAGAAAYLALGLLLRMGEAQQIWTGLWTRVRRRPPNR